jgi:hypothetical protein
MRFAFEPFRGNPSQGEHIIVYFSAQGVFDELGGTEICEECVAVIRDKDVGLVQLRVIFQGANRTITHSLQITMVDPLVVEIAERFRNVTQLQFDYQYRAVKKMIYEPVD